MDHPSLTPRYFAKTLGLFFCLLKPAFNFCLQHFLYPMRNLLSYRLSFSIQVPSSSDLLLQVYEVFLIFWCPIFPHLSCSTYLNHFLKHSCCNTMSAHSAQPSDCDMIQVPKSFSVRNWKTCLPIHWIIRFSLHGIFCPLPARFRSHWIHSIMGLHLLWYCSLDAWLWFLLQIAHLIRYIDLVLSCLRMINTLSS